MKATLISKEDGIAKIAMEITAEEYDQAEIKVYQANKNKFEIDGFRKGKAPRSIIKKMYGENIFVEDAVTEVISANYAAAVEELGLVVIDNPALDFPEFKAGEGFTAEIAVAVYPEIEIKDYVGVEIEAKDSEITDEDLANEMETLRKRNTRQVSVDRPCKEGDVVKLDFVGSVDGVEFEGGSATNFPLKLGSGSFIPGFEDQLIGMEKEVEKDVEVTFPEDYHAEDLAGKPAVFKCIIHEITEEEMPELDDEFAKDISEFDTLEELKEETKKDLQKRRDEMNENMMKEEAIEAVCEANDFDIPDVMVEREVDSILQEYDQQLRSQGASLAGYMEYMSKEEGEFREEMKIAAFKRVKQRMVIQAVAEQEAFEATEEDVQKEMENMSMAYKIGMEELEKMMGGENKKYIEEDIKMMKAMEYIYTNAKVVPAK